MTETTAPAAPGTRHLSPRDEARIAVSLDARQISEGACDLVAVHPDAADGDLLRQALTLHERTERLVRRAVIAERERGTTWEQIARAAGTTRQSAHERWSAHVQTWSDIGRSASSPGKRTWDAVEILDRWYAAHRPEQPHAVSAGLDAVRHPGSAEYEDAQRVRGQALHTRRQQHQAQDKILAREYERLKDVTGRSGQTQLAACLIACAANEEALAEIFDELAGAEPSLADEHRMSADQYRTYARHNRDFAALVTDRAEEA
ncbi:hypothetical protein [Streptomyces sp. NPDC052496]|uniref:hypothetical protein n=1 Tax=Streptomyces sp. NPDC052496 TaxID=3154951 RepID=UPI003412C03A